MGWGWGVGPLLLVSVYSFIARYELCSVSSYMNSCFLNLIGVLYQDPLHVCFFVPLVTVYEPGVFAGNM